MKGIVVDIKGKYAVILNKKGEFIRIKNNGRLRIGYEAEISSAANSKRFFSRVASIAAAFLIVFGVGLAAYSYCAPYAYVNIDINPSVKVTTNIYDRIIGIEGLNEEGLKLISPRDVKNRKLQDGIEKILGNAYKAGYLKAESDNAVMLTVSSKDQKKVEQIQEKVNLAAVKELRTKNVETEIIVEKVDSGRLQDAEKLGISPGKLLLIEKARQKEPELKVEDLKNAPVKDIVKMIKENKKAEKAEKAEQTKKVKEAGKAKQAEKAKEAGKSEKAGKTEEAGKSEKSEHKDGEKPKKGELTKKVKTKGKVKEKGEFYRRETSEEKKNQGNKDNKGSKESKDKPYKETGKPDKNNSTGKGNGGKKSKGVR